MQSFPKPPSGLGPTSSEDIIEKSKFEEAQYKENNSHGSMILPLTTSKHLIHAPMSDPNMKQASAAANQLEYDPPVVEQQPEDAQYSPEKSPLANFTAIERSKSATSN